MNEDYGEVEIKVEVEVEEGPSLFWNVYLINKWLKFFLSRFDWKTKLPKFDLFSILKIQIGSCLKKINFVGL